MSNQFAKLSGEPGSWAMPTVVRGALKRVMSDADRQMIGPVALSQLSADGRLSLYGIVSIRNVYDYDSRTHRKTGSNEALIGPEIVITHTGEALALDGEHGVKASLIERVKHQQGTLLAQTDWAIIRKADKGTAVTTATQTYRDAIRTKADEMETAITNAANTDAIAALFLSWDVDGNKSGILYDWPELDD